MMMKVWGEDWGKHAGVCAIFDSFTIIELQARKTILECWSNHIVPPDIAVRLSLIPGLSSLKDAIFQLVILMGRLMMACLDSEMF